MKNTNEMELVFDSRPVNEGFARVSVAAFMTQLNPTLEEVSDVKTAVSEAVTNALIHGYDGKVKKIMIRCWIEGQTLYVEIEMKEKELKMSKRQWNRYLRQDQNLTGQEWDLHLWKPLWTMCM